MSGANRTAILAQLDSAFMILEAGGTPDVQSVEFSLSGVRYAVTLTGGAKGAGYSFLNLMIKRVTG